MKKIIGLIFLLGSLGLQINAQSLTDKDIVGKWTVSKMTELGEMPNEQKQTMEMLKGAFLKSKFEFKTDQNFSFDFEFGEMQIKNGHWKYNDSTQSFVIQEWKDKDTDKWKLMEIYTKKEGDKILFLLSESFFTLEMIREK